MAELTPWTSSQTRAQYAAISRLRWRIFLNGFRRKGGKGDILSYLFLIPLFSVLFLGLAFAAAASAYGLASSDHLAQVSLVFWGIFVVSQLVNINLGQPGTTFDPTQLIRFPLGLGSYTAIRLFFGVLSPGNVLVTMLSFAAAIGIIVAQPALWFYALLAAAIFALANVLFTRMVFTWVDRWLSTRRAREVFTAIIFIASLGFQYWNATYNLGGSASEERIDKTRARYNAARPILNALPPGLTGNAIQSAAAHHPSTFDAEAAGTLAWAGLFLAVFALRMRTEFRGENLSDQANAVAKTKILSPPKSVAVPARAPTPELTVLGPAPSSRHTVAAMLGKEFLYLRRNTGIFYGLIAPLVMVFLFAGRLAARGNFSLIFPAALAYALLGVFPVAFNSFGLDGTGTQFYFLAPVRLRDIVLAKNLLNVCIALAEFLAISALIAYMTGLPPFSIFLSTLLWAIMTLFTELLVGNFHSIRSPKRIDPGRTAQKQARPLSAFISMGILLGCAALGWSILTLTATFHLEWLAPIILLLLAAVAAFFYWQNLESMDAYALKHRENLFEELGKKA